MCWLWKILSLFKRFLIWICQDVAAYCLEKLDNAPSPEDNARYTPLHVACHRGHLDIARLLLMYGADVSASGWGGSR